LLHALAGGLAERDLMNACKAPSGTNVRILVDDRWIGPHGIGRFAREVLKRIPGWISVGLSGRPTGLFEPWRLASRVASARPAVFFSPGFVPPAPIGRRSAVPIVFTIHDLIHLEIAGESGVARRAYYRHVVAPAARRAAAVLTVSNDARQRIVERMGADPQRVVVVGNGVSAAFRPDGPTHHMSGRYLLYIGNHRPHKNVPALLAAMSRLCADPAMHDLSLLMSGDPQPMTVRLAERSGIGDRLAFTGPLDDEELAARYRGAQVLVMPSRQEGFGLPVLEAMACGTPVVASDVPVIREVLGDGAQAESLVDPDDHAALAGAIKRALSDADWRGAARRSGLHRADAFDWECVASRVRDVLDSV